MITYHTNNVDYDDLIFEIIKETESSGIDQFSLHDDGSQIPTIGIGFNVTQGFVQNAVLDQMSPHPSLIRFHYINLTSLGGLNLAQASR